MLFNKNKNFCDIGPVCYAISKQKEICKRNVKDLKEKVNFSTRVIDEKLPVVAAEYSSTVIKKGKGIDPVLQENKAVNITLASAKMNKMVIHPGEVFSYWKTIGNVSKKDGYKEGRVIRNGKIIAGTGGGLCNLANTINVLVLHTPLEIVEFHTHSDALAPDEGKRVPFANGTSVSYNYIDYRFKNNTDQDVQLLLWCEDGKLCGELRCEKEFPFRYEIVEEDHHFSKEGDDYYRVSKIYRNTIDKATDEIVNKELIWDNHSLVMFDHDQIPKELIR